MKGLKILMLFLGTTSIAFAQEIINIQVKEIKVPCTGVGATECLQVKIEKEVEWTYFYDRIEGLILNRATVTN